MDFFRQFGPELSAIFAGHPGLSPEQSMQFTLSLQQRHSEAVRNVLTAAIRDHAGQIADGSLLAGSLLRMHIATSGSDAAPALPPDPRWVEERAALPTTIPEEDCRVDPTAPLMVAFFTDGKSYTVNVRGLCDINGTPAMIAHGLKPLFDEDRSHGLEPDQHHYLQDYRKLGLEISNGALRKHVERCRKSLAASYHDLFGFQPPQPLLIQNKLRHGYRLDPTIRLTTAKP